MFSLLKSASVFHSNKEIVPLVWNVFCRLGSVCVVGDSRFIPIDDATLSYDEKRFSTRVFNQIKN